jgi:3-oxoacyl-[acyl-carrier-protein] synthase II
MQACLRDGDWAADAVDHVNAHATSTPLGDDIEVRAIARVFGPSRPGGR